MTHYILTPDRISTRANCFDRYEPLRKHPANPVFAAAAPWEGRHVCWPTVLCVDGVYKMWYQTLVPGAADPDGESMVIDNVDVATLQCHVCYAESEDGIEWTRPALDEALADIYPGNNIVIEDTGTHIDSPSVVHDEADPDPARRYKIAYYEQTAAAQGVRTKASPDGIHWRDVGEFPAVPAQDALKFFQDARTGRYYLNLKERIRNRRSRLTSVSEDFVNWSDPVACISPNLGDDESTHFYDMLPFEHGDVTMAFLTIYDGATQVCRTELIDAGPGMEFRRLPSRPTVLGPGNPGDWDGGGIYTSSGRPAPQPDGTMRYYYYGAADRHELNWDSDEPATGVGIAEYDAGRLCGQQFVGHGGFTTVALLCRGKTLEVDADARDSLRVAIGCCGYPSPYDGYSVDEAVELTGDSRAHAVTWHGADLGPFVGKYIKVMFLGRNSVVYGFKFR